MKILITIPDQAKPDYHEIHRHLAVQIGEGGCGLKLPLTIEQTDCTTHADNYTVLMVDNRGDGESWSVMAVLKFKHCPFATPPRPLSEGIGAVDEQADHRQAMEDWEKQRDQLFADEESAILRALADAGHHFRSVTPNSSISPTGRGYADGPFIQRYEEHILVTQSGGIDC